MLEQTTEIQELSLEKVMDTKLVQNNVTEQVLAALKEQYGHLRLRSLDDKESYLEIKQAAKDCAKVRNLAIKVCKEGREEAVRVQKLWIAKEKEVVARVAEVEGPLDEEIDKFDSEVKRKEDEEKRLKEEAYINRQAVLTKMGASYSAGSFVLGDASFEAELIKGASDDVWEEAIAPKFKAEYEILEAARVAEEARRAEEQAEIERQRQELVRQQEEMRQQMEEFKRQKEEAEREQRERREAEIRRIQEEKNALRQERLLLIMPFAPQKQLGDLADLTPEQFQLELKSAEKEYHVREEERVRLIREKAAQEERERLAEAQRIAELKRQQEEARKAEELAQASDKEKYTDLIEKIKALQIPDMRSGQYRRKAQIIREKIGEILAL